MAVSETTDASSSGDAAELAPESDFPQLIIKGCQCPQYRRCKCFTPKHDLGSL
jgi:hypothetical protein